VAFAKPRLYQVESGRIDRASDMKARSKKGQLMKIEVQRCARQLAIILTMAAVAAPAADAGRYGPGSPSQAAKTKRAVYPRATCHQYCALVVEHGSDPTLIQHAQLLIRAH